MSQGSRKKSKAKVQQALSEISEEGRQAINELLDDLSKQLKEQSQTIKDLNTSLNNCQENTQTAIKDIKKANKQVKLLENQINCVRNENISLKAANKQLTNKVVKLESHSRRDNVLFDGIKESPAEDCTALLMDLLRSKLELDNVDRIKIVRCHRLGPKRQNSTKPRTIIAKFHWFGDRMSVWNARRNLKDTQIWISEDFPQEIQDRRKILTPIMKKARQLGRRAFLNVDALVIDGRSYSVDQIGQLPPDLNPAEIATPSVSDNMRVFFGGQSPLSNFHRAPFTIDDTTYEFSEKYYQKEKALFANDHEAMEDIMRATTPQECFRRAKRITFDEQRWHDSNSAATAMKKAVLAKFSQNQHLKDFLMTTGEAELVEASTNKYWGCGLPMKDKHLIADRAKWSGVNTLGKIIMDVRRHLAG